MHFSAPRLAVLAAALFPALASAFAYTIHDGNGGALPNQTSGTPIVWRENSAAFTLNFGGDFNTSAATALADWNQVGTRFQWQVSTAAAQPCNAGDRSNTAGWRFTDCGGDSFGDALAITSRSYRLVGNALYHADTDIIVDQSRNWSVHLSGSLPTNGSGNVVSYDFRRVLRHEFGHAVGLDHPDETTPPQQVTAIMNSTAGNVEFLQPDDTLGMVTLYALTDTGNTPDTGTISNVSAAAKEGGGGADSSWGILLLAVWRRVARRVYRDENQRGNKLRNY
ncbi:MAG: matrixin family metalloprotease [Pseudomonadota bacterium]